MAERSASAWDPSGRSSRRLSWPLRRPSAEGVGHAIQAGKRLHRAASPLLARPDGHFLRNAHGLSDQQQNDLGWLKESSPAFGTSMRPLFGPRAPWRPRRGWRSACC